MGVRTAAHVRKRAHRPNSHTRSSWTGATYRHNRGRVDNTAGVGKAAGAAYHLRGALRERLQPPPGKRSPLYCCCTEADAGTRRMRHGCCVKLPRTAPATLDRPASPASGRSTTAYVSVQRRDTLVHRGCHCTEQQRRGHKQCGGRAHDNGGRRESSALPRVDLYPHERWPMLVLHVTGPESPQCGANPRKRRAQFELRARHADASGLSGRTITITIVPLFSHRFRGESYAWASATCHHTHSEVKRQHNHTMYPTMCPVAPPVHVELGASPMKASHTVTGSEPHALSRL